jgi:hypothetical protein
MATEAEMDAAISALAEYWANEDDLLDPPPGPAEPDITTTDEGDQ